MSANRIDEQAFHKLYSLMERKRWIAGKSSELLELYNTCDSAPQQDIIFHLLEEFQLKTSADLEKMGNDIATKVTDDWKHKPCNTFFIAVADKDRGEIDGSQAFLQNLKNKFSSEEGWSNANFISTIGKGAHALKDDYIAILFDDFIGSGETILRKYNWYLEKCKNLKKKNVRVQIVAYAIMRECYDKLLKDGIEIYSPLILKKGISDYFPDKIAEQYKTEMCNLEGKLKQQINDYNLASYSLGYNKCETIFCFESNNISDNVFPIFWWPKMRSEEKRKTFFKRL